MTVRGIEAIKLYMPPSKSNIDTNIKEEKIKTSSAEVESATTSSMTSVERYKQEWRELLVYLSENPEHIRDKALHGNLKVSKFRSIYWALLLRVLNIDHRTWKEQRALQRTRYEHFREEFIKNPHEIHVPNDDPLSQSPQSVWNQYFSDRELFAVIRQDVIRTFPGVDFFRKLNIQHAMENILFYYAREHPYMCYRQGMHEILAPILFVVYGDYQSFLHFKEIAKSEIDETLSDVINPDFLESDSYSIFSRLMSLIESYYRITRLESTPDSYIQVQRSSRKSTEVEVISQLNSIRDKILAKEDLHLHNHLIKLDIPLHLFGIRWLRLLFGREFPLLDLLVLWDAIFADSDHFDLPNYILVAMLIHIREKLLLSDYTTCLTFLMRYPQTVDMNLILRHALHMHMPKKFDRPPNAFVYFTMNTQRNVSAHTHTEVASTSKPISSRHTRQQRNDAADAAKMERQIAMVQARNAADSAALARLHRTSDSDRFVLEGYSSNSPELKRLELRNARTVIVIARDKLQKYVDTVRKHVGKINSDELAQALDGMDELCNLLDVKFIFPLHSRTLPIDQALEAAEQQRLVDQPAPSRTAKEQASSIPTVFNQTNTVLDLSDAAELLPTTVIDRNIAYSLSSSSAATVYEKPDNGFMFVSTRMLGHIKEIELIPITSDEKIIGNSEHTQRQGKLPVADPLGQNKE